MILDHSNLISKLILIVMIQRGANILGTLNQFREEETIPIEGKLMLERQPIAMRMSVKILWNTGITLIVLQST